MGYNNYVYTVIKAGATSEAFKTDNGYPPSRKSTDETIEIVDKQDQVKLTLTKELTPEKPLYVLEDFPEWPYLSHQEALTLVSYQASAKGESDGFREVKVALIS